MMTKNATDRLATQALTRAVEKKSLGLMVIDLQMDFYNSVYHPAFENAFETIELARLHRLPIYWVAYTDPGAPLPLRLNPDKPRHQEAIDSLLFCVPGPESGEIIFVKRAENGFTNPMLKTRLKADAIDTLTFVGVSHHPKACLGSTLISFLNQNKDHKAIVIPESTDARLAEAGRIKTLDNALPEAQTRTRLHCLNNIAFAATLHDLRFPAPETGTAEPTLTPA